MQDKKKHLKECHDLRQKMKELEIENKGLIDRIKEITKEPENNH